LTPGKYPEENIQKLAFTSTSILGTLGRLER